MPTLYVPPTMTPIVVHEPDAQEVNELRATIAQLKIRNARLEIELEAKTDYYTTAIAAKNELLDDVLSTWSTMVDRLLTAEAQAKEAIRTRDEAIAANAALGIDYTVCAQELAALYRSKQQ